MDHIEIVLIPVMMLAAYYLSIVSNLFRRKKYAQHYQIESGELNPLWQKDIDGYKWFNPRHLSGVLLLSFVVYYMAGEEDFASVYRFLLGLFFTVYGMLIGRQVSNIFIYRYVIRSPDVVTGKVILNHGYMLKLSQLSLFPVALPVLAFLIYRPDVFSMGAMAGCVAMFLIHFVWIGMHENKMRREKKVKG